MKMLINYYGKKEKFDLGGSEYRPKTDVSCSSTMETLLTHNKKTDLSDVRVKILLNIACLLVRSRLGTDVCEDTS